MDYFDKIVNQYKDDIFLEARVGRPEHFEYLLKLLAKEVSRDTRHKAAEMISGMHQKISNMDMNK